MFFLNNSPSFLIKANCPQEINRQPKYAVSFNSILTQYVDEALEAFNTTLSGLTFTLHILITNKGMF